MADGKDRSIRGEELALFGIVTGLISVAVTFIAFGVSQIDAFQAYRPYVFVSAGVIYLLLPIFLLKSVRKSAMSDKRYSYSKGNDFADSFKELLSGILEHVTAFAIKYKIPIIVVVVFVAGASFSNVIPSISTGGFSLPSFELPSINFSQTTAVVTSTETPEQQASGIPVKVVEFSSAKEAGKHNISFSLADKDDQKLASDGTAKFTVLDKDGGQLYEYDFNVSADSFNQNVYSWLLDDTEITKSISGSGTAKLSFTSELGVEMSSETSIEVPKLSAADIAKTYENDYQKSAIAVGKSYEKYLFRATAVKAGFFQKLIGSEPKTFYRIDVKIENIGCCEDEFKTSTAKLTVGGSSYSPSIHGTLLGGKIKGSSVQDGYLLFENVPTTITGTKTIRMGTVVTDVSTIEYIIDA